MAVNSNLNVSRSNQSVSMVRKPAVLTNVLLGATTPTSATEIDYRHYAAGRVIVAATISGTTINWWESHEPGGTYVQCYNGGNAVTSTLPGGAAASCEIPAALAGSMFIKASMNADAAEAVTVVLKA